MGLEALVVLCPEHVQDDSSRWLHKQDVRDFLFENTGVPLRCYRRAEAKASHSARLYQEIAIDGEECYQKFPRARSRSRSWSRVERRGSSPP